MENYSSKTTRQPTMRNIDVSKNSTCCNLYVPEYNRIRVHNANVCDLHGPRYPVNPPYVNYGQWKGCVCDIVKFNSVP
jgi:hypothetical protein